MRQEEDVERQSDNGKPVEKVTSAISAASVGAAAPAGPAESRHRSYTGSTFTQSTPSAMRTHSLTQMQLLLVGCLEEF